MVRWIADRLQELSFGQNMMSKIFASINIATFIIVASVKWGFEINKLIIPIIVGVIFLMWLVGFVCEITGVRKTYREAEFRDVDFDFRKENK